MTAPRPTLPELDAASQVAAELPLPGRGLFRRSKRLESLGAPRVAPLAAVVVAGRGGRRESWTRSAELTEAELARLSDHANALPPKLAARSFQVVREKAAAVAFTCTHCMMRPGFGPCPRCLGTGRLSIETDEGAGMWTSCECGDGFVRCTVCGGTRRLLRADVESITDTVLAVEEWIVPHEARAAASALRALGPPVRTEPFACQLESPRVESAYRGAASVVTPRFFEFELLDAAERARDRVAELAGTLRPLETQTYAVPFLLLQYARGKERATAVVRRDMDGEHTAALCAG